MRPVLVALLVMSVAGCGDLQHDNPFDPQTPPDRQAKTSFRGTVALEPVGGVTPPLSGIQVSLAGTGYGAITDVNGGYVIDGVPAGSYTLQAVTPNYVTASISGIAATLDTGGRMVDVPLLAMARVRADLWGTVDLKLPNDALEQTGGASVSLAGTGAASPAAFTLAGSALSLGAQASSAQALAGTATTDANGAYVIANVPVPIGSYTLTASRVGYVTGSTEVLYVNGAFVVTPVQLLIDPGALVGAVFVVGASSNAGVTVRAKGTTLGGTPWEDVTTPDPVTGAYRLSGLPAGTYNVTFELPDHATVSVAASVSPGADTDLPTAELVRENGALLGVAQLSGSLDHSGIQVSVAPFGSVDPPIAAALTDAAGNWQLNLLPAGVNYTVTYARTPGYLSQTATVAVVARSTVNAGLVTLAAIPGRLSGAVQFEGGAPGAAGGTTVRLEGTVLSTLSLADGSWAIDGVAAGGYTVVFERAAFEPQRMQVVIGAGADVTLPDVALARARGAVSGTVQLAGAASSAGVVVSAASGATSATAVTDASGAFTISGLPVLTSGSYTVTAQKEPEWGASVTPGVVVNPNDTTTLTPVTLFPIASASLAGQAFLEGAADHSGVVATLSGADFRGVAVPPGTTATTDAAGNWSFGGLVAGSYQVTLSSVGFESPPAAGASIGTAQAVHLGSVTLERSRGSLGGQFRLASAPSSAGVVVTLQGTTFSTVTDASGAFNLDAVPIGTYTVVAAKPDWQAHTVPGVAVTRNAATLLPGSPIDLQPLATASISGVALLELQPNASGTVVTLSGADFRGVAVPPGATATTDAAGAWSFGPLVAGSYQIAFAHADFDAPAPAGLSVVTGQAASLGTVTLAASRGAVGGTVTAQGSGSHAGTVVEIAGGPDAGTAVTDAAGKWSVTGLRVGAGYGATYRRTGYVTPAASPFGIAVGATTAVAPVELLVATTASITGVATVARPTDAPSSAGILVSLTGADLNGATVTSSTTTVAGGGYTLSNLPQGTYALTFSKSYYVDQSRPGIAVAAGATATAPPVTLPVATGTVAGQIALSKGTATGFAQGSDYSGVVVTLTGLDAGVSVPATVTDASGSYRFDGVPVSTSHGAYGVLAQKTNYASGAGTVTADPDATVTVAPSPMTLSVAAGSVTGNVAVDDTGTPATPASGSVTVTLAGTAFNSTAFSASTTNTGASFALANLPAGTYELAATSANRSCSGTASITVTAGQTLDLSKTPPAYTFVCTDSVAPGAVALGVPQGAGAEPGFTASTSVAVPITGHAADGSGNLRGYQYVAGATPDWSSAPVDTDGDAWIAFPANTLTADGTWTLWVRAVDRTGNVGPAASVQVVRDTGLPGNVAINTARIYVNATSTTAILTGGTDPNFLTYQWCALPADPLAACPAPCAPTDSAASIAITFDAPDRKACVWARARDKANNASAGLTRVELISDLTPPTGPAIAPLFDPTSLKVHAEYVDFSITDAARDAPTGGATGWKSVAWIEVNAGNGFAPLCPDASCHPNGTYDPCNASCSCADAMRLCRGTTFTGIRLPLAGNRANEIAVRAVDLAGNYGSGAAQQVVTTADEALLEANPFIDEIPRVRDRVAVYSSTKDGLYKVWMTDLGPDHVWDPGSDVSCALEYGTSFAGQPKADVLRDDTIVQIANGSELVTLASGPDGAWCTGDEVRTTVATWAGYGLLQVAASTFGAGGGRDRIAFERRQSTSPFTRAVGIVEDGLVVAWPRDAVTTATGSLQLGGQVFLYQADGLWTIVNSDDAGGAYQDSFDANGATTTWTLPAGTRAAGLSRDGTLLAWIDGASPPVLHVKSAGADGRFQDGDPEVTRAAMGTAPATASVAVEAGHAVVVEGGNSSPGTFHIHHWAAGGDGTFGTADDTYTRVLPSSRQRVGAVLADGITAGRLYYTLGNPSLSGDDPDIVSTDLSATRWDAATDKPLSGIRPNGKGLLFYLDGSGFLCARDSVGTEYRSSLYGGMAEPPNHAADGDRLYWYSGSNLSLHVPDGSGRWFTTGGTTLFTKMAGAPAAGDGHVIARTNEAATAISVLRWDGATLTQVRLDTDPAFSAITNQLDAFGVSVSSAHALWTGLEGGYYRPLFRSSVNGVFGDGDDVSGILVKPPNTGASAGQKYASTAAVVAGNRIVMLTSTGFTDPHLVSVDAGADRKFNTADDREYDLGISSYLNRNTLTAAGDFAAWSVASPGVGGAQIHVANLRDLSTRVVTDWYSLKPVVRAEPSGRIYWLDGVFAANSVFVHAP